MAEETVAQGGVTPGTFAGEGSHPLDYIFHPRGVAVLGASPPSGPSGGRGGGFVEALQAMGFAGGIYPVNPKYEEVAGLRCYPTVRDIPGPVDHVISSVPAHIVPQLLDDCVAKGVRSIHFFTAGFSETGDQERADLEKLVLEKTRAAGIRVIGPNCMGLYCPSTGLSWSADFPRRPGPVAMVSQSGANASQFVSEGALRGLRFSKVISYGNAADLNEADFMAYCAQDPQSEVIACYIEGVKAGRRFFQALRHAAARKPVIVLKGGRTEAGSRAANSHTGSLAGSLIIFDAMCRQAGAVRVDGLEELVDAVVAFHFLRSIPGPGLGVVGSGGGASVLAADDIASVGLKVPPMPEAIQQELRRFTPVAGTSVRNPIDSNVWGNPKDLLETLRLVGSVPEVDVILHHVHMGWGMSSRWASDMENRLNGWMDALRQARDITGKPVAVVLRQPQTVEAMQATVQMQERCWRDGFPVFPSVPRAARAIAHVLAWQQGRLAQE